MKLKAIIGCVLVVAMLTVASPVLALSIGVSPTNIELEVPGDGSATANLQIHYFSGDVDISLINIPLRVEPSTIHVDASDEPVAIELTIYGNHSLDTQVYDGYVRFIAVSGGAATGGVQIIAKVTNIADGIAPVVEEPVVEELVVEELVEDEPVAEELVEEEEILEEEPTVEEPVVEESQEELAQPEPATPTPSPPTSTNQGFPWVIITVAAIGGALIMFGGVALWRWLRWR